MWSITSGITGRAAAACIIATFTLGLSGQARAADVFTDWTAHDDNGATGTLLGSNVGLAGTVTAGSVLDGSYPGWDLPLFTPPLTRSDALEIRGLNGSNYTLTFGAPVEDPVLHLGSLGSRIEFPVGTVVSKLSGQDTLTVSGPAVSGVAENRRPDGTTDSNGTVRLSGSFTSLPFSVTPTFGDGIIADGIYLQVGGSTPPPATPTPTATPAASGPDTTITAGPDHASGVSRPAVFEFTSNDPGARFECYLRDDDQTTDPQWAACTSPFRQGSDVPDYKLLEFGVRAIDAAGTADPTPATRTYYWAPEAFGNVRVRGIDVFQVVQPEANARMYSYDAQNEASSSPFGVSCGGGTPTAFDLIAGSCSAVGDPQDVQYRGLPLDVRKLTTAIVYVDMEGLAADDPELPLQVTLRATSPVTGGRIGPVLTRQITDPPVSTTPWIVSSERGFAKSRGFGVQFTFDTSWLNRRRNVTLNADVAIAVGNRRECFERDCGVDNAFTLRDITVDTARQPAQLLIQPLALRSRDGQTFPEPERVLKVARHLFPGGERLRLRSYPGVTDISQAVTTNPGDAACAGETTVRTCRFKAVGAEVIEWTTENPPRFDNGDGEIVQAYDIVMGVHDFQTSDSTAADLGPGGTPQAIFTEPGWANGDFLTVQQQPFTGIGRFTVNATERPITAAAHELGHVLTGPHVDACSAAGRRESWPDDFQGQLQGTLFDARGPGDDEPEPDGQLRPLYDLMSYCADDSDSGLADTLATRGDAWMSPRNWNRFFTQMMLLADRVGRGDRPRTVPAAAARSAQLRQTSTGPAPGFAVGVVGPDGGRILRVAPPDGSDAIPAPLPDSPVKLRALDAAGGLLGEAGVEVEVASEAGPEAGGTFVGPVPAGAAAVELVRDGIVLHRLERSQTPHVRLLTRRPRAGRDGLTVRWRASDPDGDALEANVDYSIDGGQTWRAVFSGPDEGSTRVQPASLAGSRRARVRVTINDGFSEVSARSAPFRVKGRRPVIRILRPIVGEQLTARGRTLLMASTRDDEGFPVDDRRVTWFAGRKRLGTGGELRTRLPAGRYVLRSVARDAGRRATARIKVRVAARKRAG